MPSPAVCWVRREMSEWSSRAFGGTVKVDFRRTRRLNAADRDVLLPPGWFASVPKESPVGGATVKVGGADDDFMYSIAAWKVTKW